MRIRFGYVAMALAIKEGSPNKTTTAAQLQKILDFEDRRNKLRRLVAENLAIQMRVLRYNVAHQVHVFRFTSKLIPLATHPMTSEWNYLKEFQPQFVEIGDFVKNHDMRVSAHPDHFAVLNSPDDRVVDATIADLKYHAELFEIMGLGSEAKLILHVGGQYKDKPGALARFKDRYLRLPASIREKLVVENDDKSFSAADVLHLCQEIKAPMVLDVHHHCCYHNHDDLAQLLPAIFSTWGNQIPKIHLSSPKSSSNFRAHADYIEAGGFVNFLTTAKALDRDFDVMIEAKQKDIAMFQLLKELSQFTGVKLVDETTILY